MIRQKIHRQRTRPNHDRWLVSYADFITLLFAFFVVLFASSQSDRKKTVELAGAIQHAFQQLGLGQTSTVPRDASVILPTEPRAIAVDASQETIAQIVRPMTSQEVSELSRELNLALTPEISRQEISLRTTPDGLVVSLQELGFFDSGSATLRPSSLDAVARLATILNRRSCRVRVEGHTDPVPIHTAKFDSNWELSTARAAGLVKLLIQQYGFDPQALSAGGYAEFHPVAPNNTPEGRRANRRLDVIILSAKVDRKIPTHELTLH